MSRRSGAPWAPTSLPALRRQWCHVLQEGLERTRESGAAPAEVLSAAEQDLADTGRAELFWVSRNMVELAVEAAATLPEWSPGAAIHTTSGLMGFAKPIGTFDWPVPGTAERVKMPVDAMGWAVRDNTVGVTCAFRTERITEQLNPGLARLPLLSHAVGVWDLEQPVAHRLEDGATSPLSVLGSTWLLMGQVRIVETRTLAAEGGTSSVAQTVSTDAVSLIELRRAARDGREDVGLGGQRRRSDKRWWVQGHWREARVGPKRALRRPVWISPYVKGNPEAELSERVTVLRR